MLLADFSTSIYNVYDIIFLFDLDFDITAYNDTYIYFFFCTCMFSLLPLKYILK